MEWLYDGLGGAECRVRCGLCLRVVVGCLGMLPLLRHSILTWLPASSSVNARRVGAKNMASSSGWAMRRQMRLLRSWGKEVRAMCPV